MSVQRDNPYGAFNFRVTADRFGDAGTIRAGFQEITGLGMEVTIAEYRNGNELENHVRKMNGMYKVPDVTFKRGLIGSLDFFSWIKDTRDGAQNVFATVKIELLDEAHIGTVMTWILSNARPMKYTAPSLNAKTGTDVAIEELVLSCENIVVE
jgi:phage tail-like protein